MTVDPQIHGKEGAFMKKMNKKTPAVFYLGICLLLVVLLSVNLTSGLYAHYTSKDIGSDGARVAAFIFDVSTSDTSQNEFIDLSSIKKPGDKVVYTFVVSNGTEDKYCEVAQAYSLEISSIGNMPLTVELQKNGVPVSLSCDGELSAGSYNCDTFTLTVEWPAAENNAAYANGSAVSRILISISSTQVD